MPGRLAIAVAIGLAGIATLPVVPAGAAELQPAAIQLANDQAANNQAASGQGMVTALVQLSSGEVISGGMDGTLRPWRDGSPIGEPIASGQEEVVSLLALRQGGWVSAGSDGSLRFWQPAPRTP